MESRSKGRDTRENVKTNGRVGEEGFLCPHRDQCLAVFLDSGWRMDMVWRFAPGPHSVKQLAAKPEMSLDSTGERSFVTRAHRFTTEQILLSLLSRIHAHSASHTVFPVVLTERNVGCVVLEFFIHSSDPS